jgi:protocatechuate 3,4-dioxygenase beta subunit
VSRTDGREGLGASRSSDDHHRGLRFDVDTLLDRRRALVVLGGLGMAGALAACSADEAAAPGASSPDASLVEVPDETGGPFPGDGSNGQNILDDSGIVRSDIRSSLGTSTTTADGIPLTIRLTVREVATGEAVAGAAVYVWQCDREGRYSMYSPGATSETYLRGVQATDDTGTATFTSVFPGCYPGRWPHVHFEVFRSVEAATSSGPIVKTSQLALTRAASEAAYGATGYEQSLENVSGLSLESDSVFRDDAGVHQLATMSGDNGRGWTADLTIGV